MALNSHISHITSKTAYSIIVAGGTGSRMQSVLPKQFILLCGKPVMMHTIEAFTKSIYQPEIIVVLHADYHELWKTLCIEHNFMFPHTLIAGGATRFHSVKNAIDHITDTDVLIAVHDAVRPMISVDIINNAYGYANECGSAVVAVKSRDSVRQLKVNTSTSLNRDEIYLVQTPQAFKSGLLKTAYEQPYDVSFTDDASVVEQSGVTIALIDGSYSNIKITFPDDIAIAETLLNKNSH